MNTGLKQLIMERCSEAINKNEAMMKLESNCNDTEYIRACAEELCYLQGFRDAMEMMNSKYEINLKG